VGEETQHSLVGEETQHSLVGEETQHSLVGETQHSLVGEETQHSLVGEETTGESFASQQGDELTLPFRHDPFSMTVPRTGGYTYAANAWAVCLVQGAIFGRPVPSPGGHHRTGCR
jgi:hypothetical protein